MLTQAEENILAQMSEVTDATDTIFTMLNNADLKFGEIRDEDGDLAEVTHGNYIKFMESRDRAVRKEAFTHVYEAYKGLINTIAPDLQLQREDRRGKRPHTQISVRPRYGPSPAAISLKRFTII